MAKKRGRPSEPNPRNIQLAFLCTVDEAKLIDKAVELENSNMSTFVRSYIMDKARQIIAIADLKARGVVVDAGRIVSLQSEINSKGVKVGSQIGSYDSEKNTLVLSQNSESESLSQTSEISEAESAPRFLEEEGFQTIFQTMKNEYGLTLENSSAEEFGKVFQELSGIPWHTNLLEESVNQELFTVNRAGRFSSKRTHPAGAFSRSKSLPSQQIAGSKKSSSSGASNASEESASLPRYFVPAILDLLRVRTDKKLCKESYWKSAIAFAKNCNLSGDKLKKESLSDLAYELYKSTANFLWACNEDAFFERNIDGLSPENIEEFAGWRNFAQRAGFCFSFRAKASELFSSNSFEFANNFKDDPLLSNRSGKLKQASQTERFIIVCLSEDILGIEPLLSFAFSENMIESWTDEEALKQLAFGKVYAAFNNAHDGTPENQLHLYSWAGISLTEIGKRLLFSGYFTADNFDEARVDLDYLTSGQTEWFKIENCSQQVQDDLASGYLSDEVILNIIQQMVYDQLVHWNVVFEEKFHSNTVPFVVRQKAKSNAK